MTAGRSRCRTTIVGTVRKSDRISDLTSPLKSRSPWWNWRANGFSVSTGYHGVCNLKMATSASSAAVTTSPYSVATDASTFLTKTLGRPLSGRSWLPFFSRVIARRCDASLAAIADGRPSTCGTRSGSTKGLSKRPNWNLRRKSRRTDTSMRASETMPCFTNATTSSGTLSPPNWSTPASSTFLTRSISERCSTPHARAGQIVLPIGRSTISPQSVQTTPS